MGDWDSLYFFEQTLDLNRRKCRILNYDKPADSVSGRIELVPNTVNGADDFLPGKPSGNLFSQILYMGVDGAVIALKFIPLNPADELTS